MVQTYTYSIRLIRRVKNPYILLCSGNPHIEEFQLIKVSHIFSLIDERRTYLAAYSSVPSLVTRKVRRISLTLHPVENNLPARRIHGRISEKVVQEHLATISLSSDYQGQFSYIVELKTFTVIERPEQMREHKNHRAHNCE